MKRFLIFLSAICICTFAIADTVNITWKNGDTTYDSTTCTVGGDLILPTPPTKTGYNFIGWEVKSAKELEYVSNSGFGQFVDTGIKFDSDEIEYETKIRFNNTNYNVAFFTRGTFVGGTSVVNNTGAGALFLSTATTNPMFKVGSKTLGSTITANSVNTYTLYIKKSTNTIRATVNDTVLNGRITGTISLDNIRLGSGTTNNAGSFKGSMYYFRIKKDGVLVLDFIPAKDPDGRACFYDKVSKTFFYSQNGDFNAGPEVE